MDKPKPFNPVERALRAVLIDAVECTDTGDGTPYPKQYVITEWAYKLVQEALASTKHATVDNLMSTPKDGK